MSELLNSGNVGLTTLRTLSEQRKEIVGNWEKSGQTFSRRFCVRAGSLKILSTGVWTKFS